MEDLLQVGARSRSQVELAALLDVDLRRLGEWLAQDRLMTLRGIDGRRAELLLELGIDGPEALAHADAAALHAAYNRRAKKAGRACNRWTKKPSSAGSPPPAPWWAARRPHPLLRPRKKASHSKTLWNSGASAAILWNVF